MCPQKTNNFRNKERHKPCKSFKAVLCYTFTIQIICPLLILFICLFIFATQANPSRKFASIRFVKEKRSKAEKRDASSGRSSDEELSSVELEGPPSSLSKKRSSSWRLAAMFTKSQSNPKPDRGIFPAYLIQLTFTLGKHCCKDFSVKLKLHQLIVIVWNLIRSDGARQRQVHLA